MERTFSRPREGLERDADGHRTGFKVYIKILRPMYPESFKRWGLKQRVHIAKHKTIWDYYSTSKAIGEPNGIPIAAMANNKTMGEYIITHYYLASGETYQVYGWTNKKTKTKVGFTKALFNITVHDADKLRFDVTKDGRLSRYFFRHEPKKRHEVAFG